MFHANEILRELKFNSLIVQVDKQFLTLSENLNYAFDKFLIEFK